LTLQGKGFYIWQISRCEGGVVDDIANQATQAGLSHVLIKVADGTDAYNVNLNTGEDLVPPVVRALHERNIQAWGWHYLYGYDPNGEADIAIQRINNLQLDGYALDAEAPYKQAEKEDAARRFMTRLRASLPTFPFALSSYRFPTLHPALPWEAFLEKCDYNMPQVYWMEAHNPSDQLVRCLREFQDVTPFRPIIPTGSAFKQGEWIPTIIDINDFLRAAQNLNLSAANFWEWGHTRRNLPELWDAIRDYPWLLDPSNRDIVDRYIMALNTNDPAQVMALYNPNAVLVTGEQTRQGAQLIRAWYERLFNQQLPYGVFNLVSSTGGVGSRQLWWKAQSDAGAVEDGIDALGLVNGKITYHYTQFTVA
jgi:hypothetical protein